MTRRIVRVAVAVSSVLVLGAGGAVAAAPRSIVKEASAHVLLASGQTRTLTVAFPDALKYANASYAGYPSVPNASPVALRHVKITGRRFVDGGSAYQATAHNENPPGTAPVEFLVAARTFEPLPHT